MTGEFQESDEEEEEDIMNDELLNDEDLLNESELEVIDDGSDACGMLFELCRSGNRGAEQEKA